MSVLCKIPLSGPLELDINGHHPLMSGCARAGDLWLFRVVPAGNAPVTFTLAGGGTCGAAVLCTSDRRALEHGLGRG